MVAEKVVAGFAERLGCQSSAKLRLPVWRPRLEVLENRTVLTVTAVVSGANVTFFSPLVTDNVYLQTSGSQVQWSTDDSTWTTLSKLTLAGPGWPTISPSN